MKKILAICLKTLREYLREPQLLLLLLSFPSLMVGIYYYGYGGARQGLSQTLQVAIVNQDTGQAGQELIGVLEQVRWEGAAVFGLQQVESADMARTAILENKAALVMILPADFSAVVHSAQAARAPRAPASITYVGNPGALNYAFARGFLDDIVTTFMRPASEQHNPPTSSLEFLPGTGTLSDFDFGVAGVIVFGILFMILTTAITLLRENSSGALVRLRLAGVRSQHILGGLTLAQMLLAIVIVPLTFGTAVALGFGRGPAGVGPGALLLAIGIGLLLSLAAVGLGLIVAAFSRSEGDAVNLGTLALIPMVFLSGAVFPMPAYPIATLAGKVINLYDLLPSTHAAEAMRRVLIFGDGPLAILYQLIALLLLSLLYLGLGVWSYQRRIRPQ